MKRFVSSLRILVPTLLLVLTIAFFVVSSTQAGTLAAVYLFMSRLKVGLTGAAGQTVEMILAIDTATTIPTGGTVKIEFPDDEDGTWCRTAGALTVTAMTASAADLNSTNWDIDAALPGTLTAACSAGSTGTVDTITISAVGELSSGTTYGVKVANSTGVLGTNGTAGEHEITVTAASGATMDSKSFKIELLSDDAVVISATVSAMPTIDCDISGDRTVNLGTLYPGGTYSTSPTGDIHTLGTSTTSSGYYWAVYGTGDGGAGVNDAGLYKSDATTYLIRSGTTDTLTFTTADVYGFGLTVEDPDTTDPAAVTTRFQDGVTGRFGTIDRTYANALLALSQSGSQGTMEYGDVIYGARAAADAVPGSYQETVYWICGGYY